MSEATAALIGDTPPGDNGTPAPTAPVVTPPGDTGTPAPVVAPAPVGKSWMDGFDDDTNAYVTNKGWKEPSDLLSSYKNLEKFAGGSKNILELPSADATPEAMDSFYNALGRPASADAYSFDLPEGGDGEMHTWFKNTAHKHGLSDNQAKSLFADYNEMAGLRAEGSVDATRQQSENDIVNLRKDWGPKYESNLDSGKRAVHTLGYDEEALSALEGKMGTSEMLKLFSQIGSKMGEDVFVDGDDKGGGFGGSAAGARQQISDLRTDTQFMDKYMSGDKDAIAKYTRLMEKAHG